MACGSHLSLWESFSSSSSNSSLLSFNELSFSWVNTFRLKLPVEIVTCEYSPDSSLIALSTLNEKFLRIWKITDGPSIEFFGSSKEYQIDYLPHPKPIDYFSFKPDLSVQKSSSKGNVRDTGLKQKNVLMTCCGDGNIRIFRESSSSLVSFNLIAVLQFTEPSYFQWISSKIFPTVDHSQHERCFFNQEEKRNDVDCLLQIAENGSFTLIELKVEKFII